MGLTPRLLVQEARPISSFGHGGRRAGRRPRSAPWRLAFGGRSLTSRGGNGSRRF